MLPKGWHKWTPILKALVLILILVCSFFSLWHEYFTIDDYLCCLPVDVYWDSWQQQQQQKKEFVTVSVQISVPFINYL